MRLLPWAKRRLQGDDGFSLVEAIVALLIASAMFTALAFSLVGGAQSALLSQQNQQAGDVLNKAVEQARSLEYDALVMRPTDLNTGEATRSPAIGSCLCYNPTNDSTSGVGVEPLAPTDANGALSPHVTTVAQNGGTFKVRRYVTVPADTAGAYKRLTVVVSWSSLGRNRTRTYSTVIAPTKRGLPLPDYKFTNSGPLGQCRNPGSSVVYGFTLRNNGARDAWALSASPNSNPAWTFYDDTDASGTYSAADQQVAVTGTGAPSTGLMEPTSTKLLFASTTLPDAATRPAPYTLSTTFRATSVAQPTYFQDLLSTTTVQAAACGAVPAPTPTATGSSSPTPTPTTTASPTPTSAPPAQPAASCPSATSVLSANAPGGTVVRYYLEPSGTGNTLAQTGMPLRRDDGSALQPGSLYNYSTDLHAAAGRLLDAGTVSSTVARSVASWTYALPGSVKLKGNGVVKFWAATTSGSTSVPQFRVVLDVLDADGTVSRTLGNVVVAGPAGGWSCEGYRPVYAQVVNETGNNGPTLAANQQLRVRILLDNAVSMRLAYGTAAYDAYLDLPYSSGTG